MPGPGVPEQRDSGLTKVRMGQRGVRIIEICGRMTNGGMGAMDGGMNQSSNGERGG